MVCFQDLFEKMKTQPIEYNGVMVQLYDKIPVSVGDRIKVKRISTNAEWRQGVNFFMEGNFEVRGNLVPFSTVFWEDTAPKVLEFKILKTDGTLKVKNVWDTGKGNMDSWHNGAAMIVEVEGNKRRYRCNDGIPDDDFDDIIFEIEILKT